MTAHSSTPQERLSDSLHALKELQDRGIVAIRAANLSRAHRERLRKNGFLQEVMKGWHIPARPDDAAGVPPQLIVRLPYNTSLLDVRAALPADKDIVEKDGLRLFSLPAALIASSPSLFEHNPTDARAALAAIRDASEILDRLLEGGHSTIAGRLAGAFRNTGRERIADDILSAMRAAGYDVREQDPFSERINLTLPRREVSPYAGRIRLTWQQMRGPIIEKFPVPPRRPSDISAYLKHVQDVYVTGACRQRTR